MKKLITKFLMAFLAIFMVVPQVNAIITDPDDYLWYDTGILGTAEDFTFPAWMEHGDSVVFKYQTYGYGTNRNADFLGQFATVTGERTLAQILGSPASGVLASAIRIPSGDSLVLNVPVCDSFYVETWGQRGVLVSCDKNDTIWYMGYSSNYAGIIGVRYHSMESMRIVIRGAQNDVYSSTQGGDASNMLQVNNYTYYPGGNFSNPNRETWVNRIKIYNKIEEGEVPAFDGTHSGWSGEYRPMASGTVDLTSHIDEGSSWEDNLYAKYASDLGVVRSMLTTSGDGFVMGDDDDFGYAIKIKDLQSIADTSNYVLGDQHNNYFQIDFSTVKFQDLTLNFNFNILYDGGDTCVVVYKLADDTQWTVLGKYLKSGDDTKMTSVSIPLPDSIANLKGNIIRIMTGNGDYSGSEFVISDLVINGYDDYYASDDGAKKLAYISNASDRIHLLDRATTVDSTDAILKYMLENTAYDVTVFTADMWTGVDTEEEVKALFADYDMVVLSEFPGSGSDIAKACQYLIGYKPFLNFKAYAYKNWNKGVTASDGDTDSLATIAPSFYYHPIFAGLNISSTGLVTPTLFDSITGAKVLQGYTGTQAGYSIASGIKSGNTCIYEDCTVPNAKYMMFAISSLQYPYLTDSCFLLINNMLSYLKGSSAFVEPNFNMVSTGAIVENVEELKAAMAYDYSALNLDEVLIQMKKSTDADGKYTLASNSIVYGRGDLVLQPYEEDEVIISGSLSSANKINISSLTVKNLVFDGADDCLFVLKAEDKISDGIFLKNSTFKNISHSIFHAEAADSAEMEVLSISNCVFENVGGDAAAAFVQLDNAPYEMDSISFTENIVKNYTGKEFINWERTDYTSTDTVIAMEITNNMFYAYSGNAAAAGNFINFASKPDSFNVYIRFNNNIVYKTAGTGSAYGNFNLFTPGEDSCSLELNRNFFYQSGISASNVAAGWNLLQDNVSFDGTAFEDEDNLLISKMSDLYTAGVNRKYVGALANYAARTTPTTLTVSNVPELKTALEIAIGGDVIELENCNDTIDVYLLSNTGFTYPTTGGTLTIKAAEGHSPKLFGRISPSNAAVLDALTYKGLHFVDSTSFEGYNNNGYSALIFVTAVSIGELTMDGCQFSDQENQFLFRTNTGCANMYIGKLAFYNNRLDNFGGTNPNDGKSLGAHLVQYQNSLAYALDTFIFENNIVTSFHGSQLFNISRPGTINPDSSMCVSISNNLFYKMGGHANSVRSFMEFDKVPVGCKVDIDINDNIFYERWSADYYALANLQLFENTDSLEVSVDVQNNFFEGEYYTSDETYGPNPMALTDSLFNLPNQSTTIKVNYTDPLTRTNLGLSTVFVSMDPFLISKSSPLYTAGTNGGFVGPESVYSIPENIKNVSEKQALGQVYTRNGVLYIQSEQAASVEIFNTIGKLIYKGQVREGINTLEGMATGNLYLIKLGNRTTKVIL